MRLPFGATVELFEQTGFTRVRHAGKHAWMLSKGDPADLSIGCQGYCGRWS